MQCSKNSYKHSRYNYVTCTKFVENFSDINSELNEINEKKEKLTKLRDSLLEPNDKIDKLINFKSEFDSLKNLAPLDLEKEISNIKDQLNDQNTPSDLETRQLLTAKLQYYEQIITYQTLIPDQINQILNKLTLVDSKLTDLINNYNNRMTEGFTNFTQKPFFPLIPDDAKENSEKFLKILNDIKQSQNFKRIQHTSNETQKRSDLLNLVNNKIKEYSHPNSPMLIEHKNYLNNEINRNRHRGLDTSELNNDLLNLENKRTGNDTKYNYKEIFTEIANKLFDKLLIENFADVNMTNPVQPMGNTESSDVSSEMTNKTETECNKTPLYISIGVLTTILVALVVYIIYKQMKTQQ